MASKTRRLALRLLLLVGSTLVAFLLGEGAVRLMGLSPPERPSREGRLLAPTGDPRRPRAYIPGAFRTHEFPRPNGEPPLRTTTHVNALGLRGPVFDPDRSVDAWRIACLGDSFTFGYGVDDADTWPARLQEALEHEPGVGPVEVWNFAVEGTHTAEQLAELEQRVLATSPDHVLLGYYLNDVGAKGDGEPPGSALSNLARRLVSPGDESPLAALRARSALVDLLAHRLFVAASLGRYAELYTDEYTDTGEGWTVVRDALRRARDLLAGRGVGFTVLTYPMLARREGGFGSDEAYAVVHAFCEAEGIDSLDLSPFLAGRPVETLRNHDVDQHPNALANRLVAEGIAAYLLRVRNR